VACCFEHSNENSTSVKPAEEMLSSEKLLCLVESVG